MTRIRRIADSDRFFFITTNLAKGIPAFSPSERDLFLKILDAQRGHFWLFGYVVMPDHVHLLLRPRGKTLIQVMRDLKSKSGLEISRQRRARGSLWQERYFDNIIRKVRHFWQKLEYMHTNPKTAGLVERAEQWKWSSYQHYQVGDGLGTVPVKLDPIELPFDPEATLWPLT